MRRIFLCTALFSLLFSTIHASPPQKRKDPANLQKLVETTAELEYQAILNRYVYDQYLQYGAGKIDEEKYLIGLMYLINREISERLENPGKARQKYYDELAGMLDEIQTLKGRLKAAGIRELDTFADDLQDRIRFTIDQQEIDFKKKKVFQDALQMLYVAEEMIKLDQLQNPQDLTTRIGRSKEKLLSAFGEVEAGGVTSSGPPPNIYQLFVEWRKTEEVKYALRLADVRLARQNLLKNSGMPELSRMLTEQLELAYTQFNLQEYDLAERMLDDVIKTYPKVGVSNIDDVYFYRAECDFALSRLVHAEEDYLALLEAYPSNPYLVQTYSRLIQSQYALSRYDKVLEYAESYFSMASPTVETYYDNQFLLAMANYNLGNYDRTVENLMVIPRNNPFYHLSRYFIGNAYGDSQLLDEAASTYVGLITDKSTPPYIHSRALYKMGILEYERFNYGAAINRLRDIPETFDRYDKVLNGLAWAYFEYERSKPEGEERDFYQARVYAESLIGNYYASPYKMEATGLLAYINQLENQPIEAIDLYRNVYQDKVALGSIEEYLGEKRNLEALHQEALTLREKALKQNNRKAFDDAAGLALHLEEEIAMLDLAESSNSGLSSYREVDRVISQIKELNGLRLRAEEAGNQQAVARIDSIQFRLAAALDEYPADIFDRGETINLFDDHPVSKYVAEENFRHQDMITTRQQVMSDMEEIDVLLLRVNRGIENAKLQNDYAKVATLEQKRENLNSLRNRYDRLLVSAFQNRTTADPYPEFNRWGDLGAFGIINVYFDQKQKMQGQLVKVAEVLDRVNTQLNQRKEVIESKIKRIEAEIRFMTMKARMEERERLRAERDRAFRESYFDTRESETPEEEN